MLLAADVAAAARRAAGRYGTPLYLYDLAALRAATAAVGEAFPDPWLRLYSLKANALPPLVAQIAAAGFGANAVSAGEVSLARRAGLQPERIALEGIGKSDRELRLAARTGLLWTSLESVEEAAALARLARRASTARPEVLVRVNPQVAPETHAGLAVGASDSKFGVLPEELPAVIAAGGGPEGPLRWRGIHLHVGSQLGAIDAWRAAARIGLRLVRLQRASLPDFDTLDFGGGFPAVYAAESEAVPSAAHFAEAVNHELAELAADARPLRLAIEPGRALVAEAGWLIGRVLHVRPRGRPIVVVDAGMTELIRPALYGALHPMFALTSLAQPADTTAPNSALEVRVDGPVCEATDTFGSFSMSQLERGDLVAIGMAGAYASSMFSTYNGRPRPAEVACDGSTLSLWRRRGSLRSLP